MFDSLKQEYSTFKRLFFTSKKRKKIILDDLIFFTDQMYAMFKAGFTLSATTTFLSKHSGSKILDDALVSISIELERGSSLSKAISSYPEIFPEYYIKNIIAAEGSGTLDETLKRLSRYLKNKKILQQQIKRTSFYPKFLLRAVVFGILFIEIFRDLILPGSGIALNTKNILLIAGILSFYLIARDFLKIYFTEGEGKRIWDKFKMEVWVVGKIYLKFLNKQFIELFVLLFKSGVSINDIFILTGDALENKLFANEIKKVTERIKKDMSIADSISPCLFISSELKSIFAIAEKSGEFEKNFEFFISRTQIEIEQDTKRAMLWIYILFLVIISLIILWMWGKYIPNYI